MKISRRDFVAFHLGLLSSFLPFFDNNQNTGGTKCGAQVGSFGQDNDGKILVVIHLAGGNDWLNTVIPYKTKSYYCDRPSLAIFPEVGLKLDEQFALHPALSEMKELYDQNQVAILLNAGYRQNTLSHHKAIENLQYALFDHDSTMLWKGHYVRSIERCLTDKLIFPTVNVEPTFLLSEGGEVRSQERIFISSLTADNQFKFDLDNHYRLHGGEGRNHVVDTTIENLRQFDFRDSNVRQLSETVSDENDDGFGRAMNLIARLVLDKTNAPMYHISLGGFDTHVDQSAKHAHLLRMLSKAIFSFQADLERGSVADKVLTIVCSEFGRSNKENDSLGTDHGYLNHVLVIGHSVEGGIYRNQA